MKSSNEPFSKSHQISNTVLAFQCFVNRISVFWGFSWISGIFEFSFLSIGHKTKTRKSWKIFILWFRTLQCMWIYVLTNVLTVWVLKLTNRNRLNLIYSEGSKAFKTQLAATWLAMSLNLFEIDVVWTVIKGFFKLHTHILVFWGFWWISGISEFLFLGIGHKTRTRKSWKIFIFWFITLQCMWICVLTTL